MPEARLEVLPKPQRDVWDFLQREAAIFQPLGFYLAGGTALALQIGHRQSGDFDFFSQQPEISEAISQWLLQSPGAILREKNAHTIHGEIRGVKISWIGNYRYPLAEKCVTFGEVSAASLLDIGLMKILAITHRATLRDYLDLAAIIRDHVPLAKLLQAAEKKYGPKFNSMIPLKALVSFEDVDPEMPVLLDKTLAGSWQRILAKAVREFSS